jgi:outer membrane protein assembly factor BamB
MNDEHPIDPLGRAAGEAVRERAGQLAPRPAPLPGGTPGRRSAGVRLVGLTVAAAAAFVLLAGGMLLVFGPTPPPMAGGPELVIDDTTPRVPTEPDDLPAEPDEAPAEPQPGSCEQLVETREMDHGGWALRLEDGAVTGPVVDDRGVLYLGSNAGARCFLAADAESGEILWTHHGAIAVGTVPIVTEEVVLAVLNRTLYAFDRASGEALWHEGVGNMGGEVEVTGDVAMFLKTTGETASVQAVDLTTGASRWEVDGIAKPWPTSVIVDAAGERLVIDSDPAKVIAVTDGRVLHEAVDRPASTWVIGLHDRWMLTLRPQNNLGAVDVTTGERWERNIPGSRNTSHHLTDDGVVVFGVDDANLYAMSLDTAEYLWTVPLPDIPSPGRLTAPDASPLPAADGAVYLSTRAGITAIDLDRRQVRWELERASATTPLHVAGDGRLYSVIGDELLEIDPTDGTPTPLGTVTDANRELASTSTTVHVRTGREGIETFRRPARP